MIINSIPELQNKIISCRQCPRLVDWCEEVAEVKRRAYMNDTYWGRPVPSFGDSQARLLIVGLAPGAHGANRTGRMFTGDRSGDWLYRALFNNGFANQAASTDRHDGLKLKDAFVSAVVHCAPPKNKPTPKERDRCLAYLLEELRLLPRVRVVVALGAFAWAGVFIALQQREIVINKSQAFGHGVTVHAGPYTLIGSYHPSQQNTFTGRLTEPMLDDIFKCASMEILTGGV